MTDSDLAALPAPTFAGRTKPITLTPVVGTPSRPYAETFVPGEETVYEANGVTVTSFPVVHAGSGAVGYRLDFAGLSFVYSGDTCAAWPLVRAGAAGS
jgi:hypothetical protein